MVEGDRGNLSEQNEGAWIKWLGSQSCDEKVPSLETLRQLKAGHCQTGRMLDSGKERRKRLTLSMKKQG